jgi:hypothetical protein
MNDDRRAEMLLKDRDKCDFEIPSLSQSPLTQIQLYLSLFSEREMDRESKMSITSLRPSNSLNSVIIKKLVLNQGIGTEFATNNIM